MPRPVGWHVLHYPAVPIRLWDEDSIACELVWSLFAKDLSHAAVSEERE